MIEHPFFAGKNLPSETEQPILSDDFLKQWREETTNKLVNLFRWVCIGFALTPLLAYLIVKYLIW
jgi:hypothetical protein